MLVSSRLLVAVVLVAAAAGCRGGVSEDPPFHLIPDMDSQQHRRPQSESPVFADHRAMRQPVEHTVARDNPLTNIHHLKNDDAFFRGVDAQGKPLSRIPFNVTQDTLDRGQDRFNIYCTPCHDKAGGGNGIVAQRSGGAFAGIPSFSATDRLKTAPDGEIFQTITNGKGRMPGYAAQIPEEDRWAIIAWFRALQTMDGGK